MLFIDLDTGNWAPHQPDVDDAVDAMQAVAARDVDETWLAAWLNERVSFAERQ